MTDDPDDDSNGTARPKLPQTRRPDDAVQGHWLLARLGKRVLRPGGAEMTRALLADADVADADVVELAPGLGRTAAEVISRHPRSYRGVEQDPEAAWRVREIVAGHGDVKTGDAAHTGLPESSADVVVGEAMLTMQSDEVKNAIVREAARLLRPGGRYAIHELALIPESLSDEIKIDIRQALTRSIKVNARPLTLPEWRQLLVSHGLVVDHVATTPMALLQPRRLIADEGLLGALRFAANVLARPAARRRVLAMRRTFGRHRDHLQAVAVIAVKPDPGDTIPNHRPASLPG